jgi:hypothetical protein
MYSIFILMTQLKTNKCLASLKTGTLDCDFLRGRKIEEIQVNSLPFYNSKINWNGMEFWDAIKLPYGDITKA